MRVSFWRLRTVPKMSLLEPWQAVKRIVGGGAGGSVINNRSPTNKVKLINTLEGEELKDLFI